MAKKIAALTTGVDVWGYFAAHLYSYPLLSIVARELVQNARDACRRINRSPRITLAVLGDDDFRYGRVICQDNGCGMDEDTILNRFLCLGGTDKAESDTGGFGIAKAVILGGCTRWEVRTHDLYVSLDHVRQQLPIEDGRRWMDGTRVVLYYDPIPKHDPRYSKLRLGVWHFVQALSWLAHNDCPCTVMARVGRNRPQTWHLEGIQTKEENLVARGQEERTSWALYQVSPLSLPPFTIPGSGTRYTVESKGKLFVRLHGLVQFSLSAGQHPDCWILDVETEALPKDPDYPFSLSREDLRQSLREAVDEVMNPHRLNPVTSHRRQMRANDRPTTMYFTGTWLGRGSENTNAWGGTRITLNPEKQEENQEPIARRVSVFAQAIDIVPGRRKSPLGYMIQIKGIDKTRRDVLAPHNLRLLAAWAQIVEMVVEAGDIEERFGVGFLFDADDLAERVEDHEGVFYLINPHLAGLAVSRPRETLLKMLFAAAHEVAHSRYPHHTEYHSSLMGDLLNRAAAPFAARMNALARELAGRKPSRLAEKFQLSFEEMLGQDQF